MSGNQLNNTFSYGSRLGERRIRLIRLGPGSGAESVSIVMEEVDFDGSHPPFIGISYVWGDPNDTQSALCDEKLINITRSLYSALWQMREEACTELIWADAICINQSDNVEKTNQVRIMGEIYANARFVFIWLGEQSETDLLGVTLMSAVCDILDEQASGAAQTDLTALGFTSIPAEAWLAMIRILRRPWFSRVWVVQEYVQAKHFMFRCGAMLVPPHAILGAARRISNFPNLRMLIQMMVDAKNFDDAAIFGPFFEFANVYTGELSLMTLFSRTADFKAADKRDRLFAFIGIASDGDTNLIDYDRSFSDILRQLTMQTIQLSIAQSDAAILFRQLSMVHTEEIGGDRSSWAPSFEFQANFQSLWSYYATERTMMTEAKLPETTFPSHEILEIRGKIIDCIKFIVEDPLRGTPITSVNKENPISVAMQLRHVLEFQHKISELVNRCSKYVTGGELYGVFWRSLIFDTEELHRRASSEMGHNFEKYQESLALSILWIENEVGTHGKRLLPSLKWQPSTPNTRDEVWNEMRLRIRELYEACDIFTNALALFSSDRVYFESANAYLGWVPYHAKVGDKICAFQGSQLPFVIRPCDGGYRLIGACYMHGIMEGQACELPTTEGSSDAMISLL